MYGLSFSTDFFYGDGEESWVASETPTSVMQAIVSLPREIQEEIATLIGSSVASESFLDDVMEKIRDTDLCDNLTSPITVYIDDEQLYSVTVYEEETPE